MQEKKNNALEKAEKTAFSFFIFPPQFDSIRSFCGL